MRTLLILAGVGQLGLALGSLAIPRILRWSEDTGRLRPLTRQVFWTYAGYIWASHVCFGLLSAFEPGWLLDRSPLSRAVAGYIAAHWGARLVIQFFCFRPAGVPPGARYKVGEAVLVTLFVLLTVVYARVAMA